MDKPCNVVMLPSNKKATKEELFIESNNQLDISCMNIGCRFNAQHLYITSDEEIKEGDFVYINLNENSRITKVKSLNGKHPIFNIEIEEGCAKLDNLTKVIASTDPTLNLPQPSPQFIQKYIEEYNKGNVITNVLVEYTFNNPEPNRNVLLLKVNPDNTINIKPIKDSWNNKELTEFFKKLVVRGCFRGTESKSGRNYNIALQTFSEEFGLDYENEVDNL